MASSYWSGVLVAFTINVATLLGASLLIAFTGIFTFGHSAFVALGAYAAGISVLKLHLPLWMAALMAIIVPVLAAFLVGAPTLRLRGDYFVIASLGLVEILTVLLQSQPRLTGGALGLTGLPVYTTVPVGFAAALVVLLLVRNFIQSTYGRACVAVREDELVAGCLGIRVSRIKMLSFLVAAATAGVAGAMTAFYSTILSPKMFGWLRSSEIAITVLLGGIGSLTGCLIGAAILTIIPEVFRGMGNWRFFAYGLVVLVVMLVRPRGILGYSEISWQGTKRALVSLVGRTRD